MKFTANHLLIINSLLILAYCKLLINQLIYAVFLNLADKSLDSGCIQKYRQT